MLILRQPAERCGAVGHLADRIEEHFRTQPLRLIAGVGLLIVLVILVGRRAELVGSALANRADQVLIVVVRDQILSQGVQQLGIGRRVRDAHVVERIDDPRPKKWAQ